MNADVLILVGAIGSAAISAGLRYTPLQRFAGVAVAAAALFPICFNIANPPDLRLDDMVFIVPPFPAALLGILATARKSRVQFWIGWGLWAVWVLAVALYFILWSIVMPYGVSLS